MYSIVHRRVVIGPHGRRDRVLGLLAGALIDLLEDRIAVDRHGDGLAHLHLVEGRLLHVHRHVADVEAGLLQNLDVGVLAHRFEIGRVRRDHDLALIRLELGIARGRVGRDGIDEIVDLRLAAPSHPNWP